MSLPGTIVFDLDGTLVDTAPDLAAAMNHVLASFGRAAVDEAAVRDMVGHGARRTIERGLALTGGGTDAMVEAGLPLFLEHYGANIAARSRPFDGVEPALDALAAAGVSLAICTNKPQRLAAALVDALGWGGRFAANLGGDSLPVRKPDAAHVLGTVAAAGGDPRDALFVGDSIVDVMAARAAELPVIAVSFGYSDRPVEALGADAVIDHYDELLPRIRHLVNR